MLTASIVLQVVLALCATAPSAAAAGADLERILRAFSVRRGQIIRPVESQAAGARYLNDTMLATNEECLIWCWETTHCNVAIFGARPFQRPDEVPGVGTSRKCYLFDCGPGGHKCSFTENNNYMTSSLIHGSSSRGHNHVEAPLQDNTVHSHEAVGEAMADSQKRGSMADFHRMNGKMTEVAMSLDPNGPALPGCFRCEEYPGCIPNHKLCDGVFDCRDKTDEIACSTKSTKKHFRFHGGKPEDDASFEEGHGKGGGHRRVEQTDTKAAGRGRSEIVALKKGMQVDITSNSGSADAKVTGSDGKSVGSAQNGAHDSPSMSISLTQVDSGDKHASPSEVQSGAILAIALGLCVTALLLVLVGCKLRLVRRRLANWRRENRKGLSLLADDDDEDDEDEDVVHGII